jgi:hypothetical protein
MKKKTQKSAELQTLPIIDEMEGLFLGNSNSNNPETIEKIKSNLLLNKDFFNLFKVNEKGFVFDIASVNRLICFIGTKISTSLGQVNISGLLDTKITSFTLEQFDIFEKDDNFFNKEIIILHNPLKPFEILGEKNMYELVNEIYLKEITKK